MQTPLTTRQAAELLSAEAGLRIGEWQVRRLFEDGDLPEPPKFGGKRVIGPELLPGIRQGLATRGWFSAGATRG